MCRKKAHISTWRFARLRSPRMLLVSLLRLDQGPLLLLLLLLLLLPARHLLQNGQQRPDYPAATRPVYAQVAYDPVQLDRVHARVLHEQQHEQTRQRLLLEQLATAARQPLHAQCRLLHVVAVAHRCVIAI